MKKTCPSYLVELLLPRQTGNGEPVPWNGSSAPCRDDQEIWGVTSFVRAPGKGLWQSGGKVEEDNIAVIAS